MKKVRNEGHRDLNLEGRRLPDLVLVVAELLYAQCGSDRPKCFEDHKDWATQVIHDHAAKKHMDVREAALAIALEADAPIRDMALL